MGKLKRVLVTLDSLLDTRLGTVALLNPDWAEALLNSGGYQRRIGNKLSRICPMIDDDAVDEAWAARSVSSLLRSGPTPIMAVLRGSVAEFALPGEHGSPGHQLEIVVNYHPYLLTEEELVMQRDIIKTVTGCHKVRHVFVPLDEFSPDTFDPYESVVYHELDDWMTMFYSRFAGHTPRDVTFYYPEIVLAKEDEYKKMPDGFAPTMLLPYIAELGVVPVARPLYEYSLLTERPYSDDT